MAIAKYGEYEDPNEPAYGTQPYVDPNAAPPGAPPAPVPPVDPNPPAADPWDTAPADGNWQAWFLQNVSALPANPGSLTQIEPKLQKHGIQVVRNAAGVAGKIRLPSGQIIDVGRSFSSGNPSSMGWQWNGGTDSGSGGSGVDLSQVSVNPEYLAPWTGTAPTGPAVPEFQSPGEFEQPTGDDVLKDPSFLWRVDQGRGAIENSAAAKGVLNSGGTLSDILNYGQKAGSQEFSNIWDRAYGVWNSKWNNALGAFRARESSSNDAYQRAWSQYTDARDTHYRNQNEPFSKLIQAANIGAGAAR
jgi:hypothetical protein